jgi:hypothetical protein
MRIGIELMPTVWILTLPFWASLAVGQMIDNTQAPNNAKAGINKSLEEEIGPGRGDIYTLNSSLFNINRDPFRAIRRGRQLFQRKFTRMQGQGPNIGDGVGDLNTTVGIGAGLVDSCGGCHARPRGSAGFGGDVVTRPDSRSAPHLFGLGLKEMLADEITSDLRAIRIQAINSAIRSKIPISLPLNSKGINYGAITAHPDGSIDTSQVQGVDPDLRVRPFFAQGGTISIREFVAGALHAEMGMEASADPDLTAASNGARIVTPSGMVLDGLQDKIEAPPPPDRDNGSEVDTALLDYLEFYLLNYFKPGSGNETESTRTGRRFFASIGCESCHIGNLQIDRDRRVADVNTTYDPVKGIFNRLFATVTPLLHSADDARGLPSLKQPNYQAFLVQDIYTDFKRHDLGPNFYERNWDGTVQTLFLTRALWGVGTTAPYAHDGRSISLEEVILRHGGEAQASRDAFAHLNPLHQERVIDFLKSLILFPPDDTASTLDPGNPGAANFPQLGHGSIKLTLLFNDPADPE